MQKMVVPLLLLSLVCFLFLYRLKMLVAIIWALSLPLKTNRLSLAPSLSNPARLHTWQ